MSFWNQQYGAAQYKYGTAPNVFLVQQETLLPRGADVLVPGDGEGRNGVWLASQGHRVTTVDGSQAGVEKALRLATERQVTITAHCDDLLRWTPEPSSADAVVLAYVHFIPEERRIAHAAMLSALRDGGVLILEAFHPRQREFESFGPKDVAMLYTLAMLRDDLAHVPHVSFDELLASEERVELDEGPGHRGPGHVTRLVARARHRQR